MFSSVIIFLILIPGKVEDSIKLSRYAMTSLTTGKKAQNRIIEISDSSSNSDAPPPVPKFAKGRKAFSRVSSAPVTATFKSQVC